MCLFVFQIMRLAFTGTKYEALLNLYKSTTCTFVGDEVAVAKVSNRTKSKCYSDGKHYHDFMKVHYRPLIHKAKC